MDAAIFCFVKDVNFEFVHLREKRKRFYNGGNVTRR